jgi:O-antigen ligase
VRAFYGSPNNLALYLERTLAVCLALALFGRIWQVRLAGAGVAAVQGVALLLTFSKGALLLGLPVMLGVLWLGGWMILGRQARPRRLLWMVAGVGALALLATTPFLTTERFQRLLDFSQGTGFLRLNLWRSAWQMALDHPLLGVGPDNFLYAYRSQYLLPAAWQEPNLNHPHNWLLDWWTRLGLPGLVLAFIWFGWMARRLWRGVRVGAQPVLSLGLLAAVAAGLAHGLIDASFALPDLILVWVLIGYLAVAVSEPP